MAGERPQRAAPPVHADPLLAVQRGLGNGYLQRSGGCAVPERDTVAGGTGGSRCGGGGCAGCALRRRLQPKLTVGAAGDLYEREADRVAERIVGGPVPRPESMPAPEGPRVPIRRLPADPGPGAGEVADAALPSGGGRPLSIATREYMEPRFGLDFAHVRVHAGPGADGLAARIGARAFTSGADIFLRGGEGEHDRHLMAHELTHVVQQQGEGPLVGRGAAPLVQRAIAPELDRIESYLSYGVFDWAITDEEALRALALLKTLSRYQQAVFFSDPKYVHRLRDNLPDDRVAELDTLQADVGALQAPASTVEAIRERLSYGLFDWAVTDRDAVEALEMLKQLSGVQLATALGSINYARLLDNLPEARKPELTDLWDRAMGTGGARPAEEEQHPGTILKSITFRSDHGLMKDNEDWESDGAFYGEPEWYVDKGRVISRPISQSRGSNVIAEVALNVVPLTAPAAPVRLTGTSPEPALNFDFAGTMRGGLNQALTLTSTGKLPDTIRALEDRPVVWALEWGNWKHEIGRTRHNIYVTIATPLAPGEVTIRRMRTAVRLVGAVADRKGSLDPHPLVKGVMETWGEYNLRVQYENAWKLADDLETGAQCIDIVRFVNGLLQTVGCPGTATAIVVWARPGGPGDLVTPNTPIRSVWVHGGLNWLGPHPAHPDWRAGLMDANGCPNMYEAALEFDYGGMLRYYPGGVPMDHDYTSVLDVLHVFQCLVWYTRVSGDEYNIEEILTTYPKGSCHLGRIRCD